MAGNTFYFGWEVELMEWLQQQAGIWGTKLAVFFTLFGEVMLMIAIMGYIYWGYDKKFGKYVGTNMVTSLLFMSEIKNIFLRRRPYFDHPSIECRRPAEVKEEVYDLVAQGYSFPSGHAANAASAYGSIAIYKKKNKWMWMVAVFMILMIDVSRLVLGVHYPTDVIAGNAVGLFGIFLVKILQKKITNRNVVYGILIILGLPGLFYCKSNDYFTSYGLMFGIFLGFIIEEKYVQFENTRNVGKQILRTVFGVILFLMLDTVLKLPFSKELLNAGTFASHMIRMGRYFLLGMIEIGCYPALFKKFNI